LEPFLVDGEWSPGDGRSTIDVLDPATGAVLTTVAQASPQDVEAAVAAATRAFADGRWSRQAPIERTRILHRVADLIEENLEELAVLETRDNGKPIERSRADTASGARAFRHFAGAATRLTGTVVPIDGGNHHVYTVLEPVGVAALILPWNFPIMTACFKLAPALAAGCPVVVKPAEQTPLTTLRLAAICAEAGVPPGVVNVLTGDGAVGAELSRHPGVSANRYCPISTVASPKARRSPWAAVFPSAPDISWSRRCSRVSRTTCESPARRSSDRWPA
jgi:phenylacetaldehyde dehydrogenase